MQIPSAYRHKQFCLKKVLFSFSSCNKTFPRLDSLKKHSLHAVRILASIVIFVIKSSCPHGTIEDTQALLERTRQCTRENC